MYALAMLQQILERKPYLAWYVRNKAQLSDESALEHILAYGNWEDIMSAQNMIGIEKMQAIFKNICNKKRVNLKPRTINYFEKYFAKYA